MAVLQPQPWWSIQYAYVVTQPVSFVYEVKTLAPRRA